MGSSQLKTYRVSGNSMNPLLYDGDRILVKSTTKYQVGDIVIAIHPIQTDLTIVKRIESITSEGQFRLRGSNPNESTDQFGPVEQKGIIGKMISKLD